MAKPFIENGKWAFRVSIDGNRIYRSGFATEAQAREELNQLRAEHKQFDKPQGLGPHRTTVASALVNYGLQTLPFKKGAEKEANRINRYLRSLGYPLVEVAHIDATSSVKAGMRGPATTAPIYFTVRTKAPQAQRVIPASLRAHRTALSQESRATETLRKRLGSTLMADVSSFQLQAFVDTMVRDGYSASTVHNEVAILRQLFKHARSKWKWSRPLNNPALGLDLPTIDNARDRILTEAEWETLVGPLADYDNPYVLPLVCTMLETAMRSCEPLTLMCWRDIDWNRRILNLPDGKTGKRDVPLSPGATLILSTMQGNQLAAAQDDRVFPLTYEALKKAWAVACQKARIEGIKPHDLRHTSATRYSLEFNGNMPVLKLITGHKTTKMVERYVNLKPAHVVALMHNEELGKDTAPAGHISDIAASAVELITHEFWLRPRKRRAWSDEMMGIEARQLPDAQSAAQSAPEPEPDTPTNVVYLKFGRAA